MDDIESIRKAYQLYEEMQKRDFGGSVNVICTFAELDQEILEKNFQAVQEASKVIGDCYRDRDFQDCEDPHIALLRIIRNEALGLESVVQQGPESMEEIISKGRILKRLGTAFAFQLQCYGQVLEAYSDK